MAHAAGGFGLAAKSLAYLFIGGELGSYDLERNDSLGSDVRSQKDRAHPALSKQAVEEILAVERFAYEFVEGCHRRKTSIRRSGLPFYQARIDQLRSKECLTDEIKSSSRL